MIIAGESLKKSHLLESSSDILNMEEGSSIIGRGNSLDYSKVGVKTLKTTFSIFSKNVAKALGECFFQETELYQIYVPILSDIGQEDCPPEICAENPYLCVKPADSFISPFQHKMHLLATFTAQTNFKKV